MSTRRCDLTRLGIILTGHFDFPTGYASTQYVTQIARGLSEAGADLLVVPIKGNPNIACHPPKVSGNEPTTGLSYVAPKTVRGFGLRSLNRIATIAIGQMNLLSAVVNMRRTSIGKIVLYYYGRSVMQFRILRFLRKIFGAVLIVHFVEWDPGLQSATLKKKRRALSAFRTLVLGADGVIVISRFLKRKVQEVAKDSRPKLLVHHMYPLTDIHAIDNAKSHYTPAPYILYCAHLSAYLNDAKFVVNAFAKNPCTSEQLFLLGPLNTPDRAELLEVVASFELGDRVRILTDFVSQEKLYAYYKGAAALLAPLNADEQSSARFPFKIAQYLVSGRPVISSDVGDVGSLLKKHNAGFVAKPGDVVGFSALIGSALDKTTSSVIASNGRELGLALFDYRAETKKLLNFIKGVGGGRHTSEPA